MNYEKLDKEGALRRLFERRQAQQARESINRRLELEYRRILVLVETSEHIRSYDYDASIIAGLLDSNLFMIPVEVTTGSVIHIPYYETFSEMHTPIQKILQSHNLGSAFITLDDIVSDTLGELYGN